MLEFVGKHHIEQFVELAHGVGAQEGIPAYGLTGLHVDASGACRLGSLGKESGQHVQAVGPVAAHLGHLLHEAGLACAVGADYRVRGAGHEGQFPERLRRGLSLLFHGILCFMS